VEQRIARHQEDVGPLASGRLDGGLDLTGLGCRKQLHPEAQRLGRLGHLDRQRQPVNLVRRVREDGQPSGRRDDLLQQLDLLGDEAARHERRDAGDGPARPREALDQARPDGVGHPDEHQRNRAGRLLRGPRGLG
jgi:hypothetical protein